MKAGLHIVWIQLYGNSLCVRRVFYGAPVEYARSSGGLKLWQVIIMPYNEIIARGVREVIRLKLRKNGDVRYSTLTHGARLDSVAKG